MNKTEKALGPPPERKRGFAVGALTKALDESTLTEVARAYLIIEGDSIDTCSQLYRAILAHPEMLQALTKAVEPWPPEAILIDETLLKFRLREDMPTIVAQPDKPPAF
jgi:hypothetical protein